MSGGMSYKSGRDMPPGMQEKLALQHLVDLQKMYDVPSPDSAQAVVARNILKNMRENTSTDPFPM